MAPEEETGPLIPPGPARAVTAAAGGGGGGLWGGSGKEVGAAPRRVCGSSTPPEAAAGGVRCGSNRRPGGDAASGQAGAMGCGGRRAGLGWALPPFPLQSSPQREAVRDGQGERSSAGSSGPLLAVRCLGPGGGACVCLLFSSFTCGAGAAGAWPDSAEALSRVWKQGCRRDFSSCYCLRALQLNPRLFFFYCCCVVRNER